MGWFPLPRHLSAPGRHQQAWGCGLTSGDNKSGDAALLLASAASPSLGGSNPAPAMGQELLIGPVENLQY